MNKQDYPKVLIGTVTYEGKDYIQEEHEQAIQNIKYPNTSRLVVDNSRGTSYVETLRRRGVNAVTVERGESSHEAIKNGYQRLWNHVLDNDFDYLLTVESDLIPQRDVIDRLLMHDRPIVGSWYFLGKKDQNAALQPCIMVDKKDEETGHIGSKMLGAIENEDGTKNLDVGVIQQWYNSGLRRCHGCGFGCTLIHRSIIEAIPELDYVKTDTHEKHTDSWFYYQLRNNDISVFVDTDRVVEHHPSDWDAVKDRYSDDIQED